jgi:hypothetical protein
MIHLEESLQADPDLHSPLPFRSTNPGQTSGSVNATAIAEGGWIMFLFPFLFLCLTRAVVAAIKKTFRRPMPSLAPHECTTAAPQSHSQDAAR